jgi:DNA-binding transcriptional LysR family regulator
LQALALQARLPLPSATGNMILQATSVFFNAHSAAEPVEAANTPRIVSIELLATFLLESPLKNRTLEVLDIGAEAEGATIYIAYPEHLRSSGKIRALTTWLRRSIGEPAYWDIGWQFRTTRADQYQR